MGCPQERFTFTHSFSCRLSQNTSVVETLGNLNDLFSSPTCGENRVVTLVKASVTVLSWDRG